MSQTDLPSNETSASSMSGIIPILVYCAMRENSPERLLEWIGSSKKDLMDLIRSRLKVAAQRAKELDDEQTESN